MRCCGSSKLGGQSLGHPAPRGHLVVGVRNRALQVTTVFGHPDIERSRKRRHCHRRLPTRHFYPTADYALLGEPSLAAREGNASLKSR